MLADVVRFNRRALIDLAENRVDGETLGEYLGARRYHPAFAEHYLLALGSAIWSCAGADIHPFPARPHLEIFACTACCRWAGAHDGVTSPAATPATCGG